MANHIPNCDKCGKAGTRNEAFDSYYCVDCATWIESACGDKDCSFCAKRPPTPPDGHPSYCSECGCIKESGTHAPECPKK